MFINKENYFALKQQCDAQQITLVAVSKTKPVAALQELYDLGHRHFGENYVQELVDKYEQLPKDICWHFIGHLQSNKVKYIAPITHLIHSIDSQKLLAEVNKQGIKLQKNIACLLQMHIAQEETKFGMDELELKTILQEKNNYTNVIIKGLMGMASFTTNEAQVSTEFETIQKIQTALQLPLLSTGMSGDYKLAIQNGSNIIRVGSLIFGNRNYTNAN
jgi:PLP dependent protein